MGEVIFLLVLVFFLIGLLVVVIRTTRQTIKQRINVIEPIGTIVRDWQIARFEPNTEAVKKQFQSIVSGNSSPGSLIESVMASVAAKCKLRSRATKMKVISRQTIGPLAEQLILEDGNQRQSVVIGPLDQIGQYVDGKYNGRFQRLSLQAAENGYLPLAMAMAFVHGQSGREVKHRLTGMLLLEPIIETSQLDRHDPIRFLTVAPVQFGLSLYQQVFSTHSTSTDVPFGLNADELQTLAPKFAEADLAKAVVIGSADVQARHRVLQSWRHNFDCRYVSVNPEDQDLPPLK